MGMYVSPCPCSPLLSGGQREREELLKVSNRTAIGCQPTEPHSQQIFPS